MKLKQKILGLGLAALLNGCSDKYSENVSFEGEIQQIDYTETNLIFDDYGGAELKSELNRKVLVNFNHNLPRSLEQNLKVGDILRVQGCTATGVIQNDDYALVKLQDCTHFYKH